MRSEWGALFCLFSCLSFIFWSLFIFLCFWVAVPQGSVSVIKLHSQVLSRVMFWFKVCLCGVMTTDASERRVAREKHWVLWGERWSRASFSNVVARIVGKTWHHCFLVWAQERCRRLNATWLNFHCHFCQGLKNVLLSLSVIERCVTLEIVFDLKMKYF